MEIEALFGKKNNYFGVVIEMMIEHINQWDGLWWLEKTDRVQRAGR